MKDHPFCSRCGWRPPTGVDGQPILAALDVDHIVPRAAFEGRMALPHRASAEAAADRPDNLRVLCTRCHRLATLWQRGIRWLEPGGPPGPPAPQRPPASPGAPPA